MLPDEIVQISHPQAIKIALTQLHQMYKLQNLQIDVHNLPACQALALASAGQPSSHSPLEVGVANSPSLLLFLQPPLQLFSLWLLALEPFCQGLPNLSVLRPVCQSAAADVFTLKAYRAANLMFFALYIVSAEAHVLLPGCKHTTRKQTFKLINTGMHVWS